jgi:hypothetical protein
MKITLEHYSETITVETKSEAITAQDFVDLMYRLGIMVGYHETNVADSCAELAETYYTHDTIAINPDACLKHAYAETKHMKQ